jgi:hypothetical protein
VNGYDRAQAFREQRCRVRPSLNQSIAVAVPAFGQRCQVQGGDRLTRMVEDQDDGARPAFGELSVDLGIIQGTSLGNQPKT